MLKRNHLVSSAKMLEIIKTDINKILIYYHIQIYIQFILVGAEKFSALPTKKF